MKKALQLEESNQSLMEQLVEKEKDVQLVRDEKDELKKQTDAEVIDCVSSRIGSYPVLSNCAGADRRVQEAAQRHAEGIRSDAEGNARYDAPKTGDCAHNTTRWNHVMTT